MLVLDQLFKYFSHETSFKVGHIAHVKHNRPGVNLFKKFIYDRLSIINLYVLGQQCGVVVLILDVLRLLFLSEFVLVPQVFTPLADSPFLGSLQSLFILSHLLISFE